MAQFGSAAKDPSMDEILASIRKIIEEGDSAAVKKTVDVFDTNPIGPAANDVTRAYAAPEPTVDLGVADDYRTRSRSTYESDLRPAISSDVEAALDAVTFRALNAAAAASTSDIEFGDFELDLAEEDSAPASAQAVAEVDFSRPSLMSSNASRHVAASFSELADALAHNRQRSLDEIAEQVLRPMLQDWLDNNLPTMVERMVREEIERVARGG